MIPKTIKRKHILKSIKQVDTDGYENKYESTKYDLLHNGRRFPPKYVISLAHEFVAGMPQELLKPVNCVVEEVVQQETEDEIILF